MGSLAIRLVAGLWLVGTVEAVRAAAISAATAGAFERAGMGIKEVANADRAMLLEPVNSEEDIQCGNTGDARGARRWQPSSTAS